ncbi:MAG TPA: hypothetical protein VF290_00550 [Pyrinomonadaceae bacterium]
MLRLTKRCLVVTTSYLLVLLSVSAMTLGRPVEIPVAEYLRLTQALMELSVQEWQDRVDSATENKSDRKKLEQKLEEVAERNRSQRNEVYRRFGISQKEALQYASSHASEIESYLADNPEVNNSIDSLKERIGALVQQFEGIVKPPEEGDRK